MLTDLDSPWAMLEGEVINEQFHLQQFLGAGGFGGVFQTDEVIRDTWLRTLATKIILIKNSDYVAYYLKELQIALDFEHPNLIRCYGRGIGKIKKYSFLYLLMELAEEDLFKRMRRGDFSREEIKAIVKDITAGLVYLHENRQMHLDIKPENLFRVNSTWKIGDYGLIHVLDIHDSHIKLSSNLSLGTTHYVPPESYRGVISPAWDIWSLGIITVILLTGKYPIQSQTQEELGEKIKKGQFDNLNWDDLEQPWRKIIQGCLQVDRQQRWTAEKVLNALQPPVIQFASSPVSSSPNPPISPASPSPHLQIPLVPPSRNPQVLILDLPNNIKLEMIKIPAGSFLMGSVDYEKPQHRVTLQEYYLGKYPVTQEQWQAVMGNNPSEFKDIPRQQWEVEFFDGRMSIVK